MSRQQTTTTRRAARPSGVRPTPPGQPHRQASAHAGTAAPILACGARVCLAADARQRVYVTVGEEWYGLTRALRLVREETATNPLAVRYVAPAAALVSAPARDGLWARTDGIDGQVA